jgi:hypothetical protein
MSKNSILFVHFERMFHEPQVRMDSHTNKHTCSAKESDILLR